MALDRFTTTSVDDAGCLYGSNPLTLCIEKKAPAAFMQKLIALAAQHAPQTLSNPDANGCTPLYVAIESGDTQAVQMLLDAGADQDVPCAFLQNEKPHYSPTAYQLAINKGSTEIFERMLQKKLKSLDRHLHR